MKLSRLLLAICLVASLGCDPDIGNLNLASGTLVVTVRTIGANLDADGYTVSVAGGPGEAIGINGSMTFSIMPITIIVELRGIADNCTVANNPRTVDVSVPTTTTFVVECS